MVSSAINIQNHKRLANFRKHSKQGNSYNYLLHQNSNNDYKLITMDKPTIIAHRGADEFAPENTLPAIDIAAKMHYWGVELDVCSSSDGVLYLLHDGGLGRMTTGRGQITKTTSAQIDKLNIRKDKNPNASMYPNLKLAKFEDGLIECEKYNLVPIFDIKLLSNNERDMNTFLSIIDKHNCENKVLVHSCVNFPAIEYLRSRDSKIFIMPTINNPNDKPHGYAYTKSFGYTALDCKFSGLSRKDILRAHKDGLKVFCWTIDKPTDLRKAIRMGVDFVYSDNLPPDYEDYVPTT